MRHMLSSLKENGANYTFMTDGAVASNAKNSSKLALINIIFPGC